MNKESGKIKNVVAYLNQLAPPSLQESYDNAGLLLGDPNWECTGIIICLDSIEEVIDEAIAVGCNLVVAHHPILFSGLKQINGTNYIERTITKAIKHDIAVFAIHTNLDNVIHGVNGVIGKHLGLTNIRPLQLKKGILRKMVVFAPSSAAEKIKQSLFDAGAGEIGEYSECSFSVTGQGSFKASSNSNPYVGEKGKRHTEKEERIEVIYLAYLEHKILEAMLSVHPYEEVAYDIIPLKNNTPKIGSGGIGELSVPVETMTFLKSIKEIFGASSLRYTRTLTSTIQRVAFCGGSGSFLLPAAIAQNADLFVTSDIKYHQFFDANNQICIADIGHYESEHLIIRYLAEKLKENFTNFAVRLTKVNTNPINYL